MSSAFEKLQQHLKQLPGLGFRSSERIALHLLVEKPERLPQLVAALEEAARTVRRCSRCGNIAESELCAICADERRDQSVVCVVEQGAGSRGAGTERGVSRRVSCAAWEIVAAAWGWSAGSEFRGVVCAHGDGRDRGVDSGVVERRGRRGDVPLSDGATRGAGT